MKKHAWLSGDRKHRFTLRRTWDEALPVFVVIGLNPSTADETADDPTIRKCIHFARREGCGSLLMLNLFSFRSTDSSVLKGMKTDDLTFRTENTKVVKEETAKAVKAGGIVVVAWGGKGEIHNYGDFFKIVLGGIPLKCLGHTTKGHPKHPLYLANDTPLEAWTPWRYQ